MRRANFNLLTQPLVAAVSGTLCLAAIIESWLLSGPGTVAAGSSVQLFLLALALVIGLYLSKQFPVHIRYTTKMELGSVTLYLMAALLPTALALVAAVIGVCVSEFAVRRVRGLEWTDIVTQASRLGLLVCTASVIVHLPSSGLIEDAALLVAAAVVMQAGELLTSPLIIAPITGERPWHIIRENGQGMILPESGQYFMGLIGVALAHVDRNDPWAVMLLLLPIAMLYKTSKRAKEMHETTRLLLENMADSVDNRDSFTHEHSKRVTEWTRALVKELGLTGPEAQLITTAARVHDIGKIMVPDNILHKHERLTPEEWEIMEAHPARGAEMLERYPAFARGAAIVRGHHERYDGKGYPDKIRGTDIPFGARILAVADSFDAMVSDRPYRKGMAWERAAGILSAGRGTQWDPDLVAAFLHIVEPQLEAEAARASMPAPAMDHHVTV